MAVKNGSLWVTFLMPTMCSASISTMRSTRRKGSGGANGPNFSDIQDCHGSSHYNAEACYSYDEPLKRSMSCNHCQGRKRSLRAAECTRQAGIRSGDRLEFKVSPRTITITTVEPPPISPPKRTGCYP